MAVGENFIVTKFFQTVQIKGKLHIR